MLKKVPSEKFFCEFQLITVLIMIRDYYSFFQLSNFHILQTSATNKMKMKTQ